MPRRREVPKRKISKDPKYGSELLAKFMNVLMLDGKKSTAEHIVYGALEKLFAHVQKAGIRLDNDQGNEDEGGAGGDGLKRQYIASFEKAIEKIKPTVEVRSRRVGGATYQVPVEVRPERSLALAMRWVINAARKRTEHGMVARLAGELCDAVEGKGAARKKLEEVHKMAKANQAFAHFRW